MSDPIVLTPAVPFLEARAYLSTRKEFLCTLNPIQTGNECFFGLFNCARPIPQFIDLTDPDNDEHNDFHRFTFSASTGYTIDAVLVNTITGVETPIVDNTYGILRDIGQIPLRLEVWDFITDWNAIQAGLGFGCYHFEFTLKNGSGSTIEEKKSPCFRLMQFDCDDAHQTVRIETKQTGYIVNGFDYRDIDTIEKVGAFFQTVKGYFQQIRWYGIMQIDLPEEESDVYQDSNRIERQIQQKVTEKWKLRLYGLRAEIGQPIIKDMFLADEVFLSDYNMSNYQQYRKVPVRKMSTDEITWNRLNRNINIEWTFKSTNEGTVKRIFG